MTCTCTTCPVHKRSAGWWPMLIPALLLLACGGLVERDWFASSYREQFGWTNPPAGCLTACVVGGAGCAMAGPSGEHVTCASGDDPVMLRDSSFGTCIVEAKPCDTVVAP